MLRNQLLIRVGVSHEGQIEPIAVVTGKVCKVEGFLQGSVLKLTQIYLCFRDIV